MEFQRRQLQRANHCAGQRALQVRHHADAYLIIELKEKVQDGAVLRLYNAIGLKLDEYEIGPNTNEILLTTENLPSGNYYIHFTNGIKVSSKKLVLLGE